MSVQAMAARVARVLERAESLFARPADVAPDTTVIAGAVEASHSIRALSDDLSGTAADAHRDAMGAATDRLHGAADADDALASTLAHAGRNHHGGQTDATAVRSSAAESSAAADTFTGLPAAQVMALTALRNRVAAMQVLVTRHAEDASAAAAAIRNLGYH